MTAKVNKDRFGINYDTSWAKSWWARGLRSIGVWGFMKPSIGVYGTPKVLGADKLTKTNGPVVFVANHHSHSDTTILLATIPAKFRSRLSIAAGADYFFPNRFGSMLSALFIGAIPIDREKVSKLSISNAKKALESGDNLLIFPSGSRSPEGELTNHKPGAAFIAQKARVPIVPIYISGTGKVLPKGKNWPTKAQCHVVFGDPILPTRHDDPRQLAKEAQASIERLAQSLSVVTSNELPGG